MRFLPFAVQHNDMDLNFSILFADKRSLLATLIRRAALISEGRYFELNDNCILTFSVVFFKTIASIYQLLIFCFRKINRFVNRCVKTPLRWDTFNIS